MVAFQYFIVIFAMLVSVCQAMTIGPPVLATGCTRDGKTYKEGASFQPTPCEHCFCQNAQVICAVADCFFTPCVDPVHDPTKCCPVCPNGENCRHRDGTIIKKGDTYHPDPNTSCQCSQSHFMFGGNQAICATKLEPVTATVQQVS